MITNAKRAAREVKALRRKAERGKGLSSQELARLRQVRGRVLKLMSIEYAETHSE
jgi:hypothetical protein